MSAAATRASHGGVELRADCTRCVGLCCVALTLVRSADFAIDKPAGERCRHLDDGNRCRIHAELRPRGFPGCVAYDCFGAGQRVAASGAPVELMVQAFPILRQLHEMLCYLAQGRSRSEASDLHPVLDRLSGEVEALAGTEPGDLRDLDLTEVRSRVADLLRATAAQVQAGYPQVSVPRPGERRPGGDLRGAGLRNALLLGVDLRGADLRDAVLLGADLRGARLDGADLSSALFLSQAQLNSAQGDRTTRIPPDLTVPEHWTAGEPARS